MFRTVAIIAFIVTFAGIGVHCLVFPVTGERRWGPVHILRRLVCLFTLFFIEQKLSPLGVLKKLVFLLALLCFVVLAVTGFYQRLVFGVPISGYFVMVHATFAPVFAICLAVLAVLWARSHRFERSDWPLLQRIIERVTLWKTSTEESVYKSASVVQKITFWVIVFLSLPLILSIVSSMFPLFGTNWQEFLLAAHRWTALVFAVVAIIHIYLVIRSQLKQ